MESKHVGPDGHMSVGTKDYTIAGRHGPVAARCYRTHADSTQPGLVWLHGGGFIGVDLVIPAADQVARSLAGSGCVVISGDYQKCLGGIHYPIPNDDVMDLWLWVMQNAMDLGVDPFRVHLGGASSGAALAATASLRLRDGEGPSPRSLLLVYPIVHYELPEPSAPLAKLVQENAGLVLAPEFVRTMSENYVGGLDLLHHPYAFAANAELSDLPPTLIINSEIDTMRASGEAYGAALSRAGVELDIQCEPGAQHGHLNEPFGAAAHRSIERMVSWIKAHSENTAPPFES